MRRRTQQRLLWDGHQDNRQIDCWGVISSLSALCTRQVANTRGGAIIPHARVNNSFMTHCFSWCTVASRLEPSFIRKRATSLGQPAGDTCHNMFSLPLFSSIPPDTPYLPPVLNLLCRERKSAPAYRQKFLGFIYNNPGRALQDDEKKKTLGLSQSSKRTRHAMASLHVVLQLLVLPASCTPK